MMMILTGIVIDGGWMYWQYRRAETTVSASAQTASHAIDEDYFRETNQVRLDSSLALSIAQDFVALNERGHVQLQSISVGASEVSVTATAYVETLFLRMAGINQLPMRVFGRAYPAFGINTEGQ